MDGLTMREGKGEEEDNRETKLQQQVKANIAGKTNASTAFKDAFSAFSSQSSSCYYLTTQNFVLLYPF